MSGAEAAIEAIVERVEPKKEALAALDTLLAPSSLLLTNTSSISITEIAEAFGDPARVAGMHFFNPVPVLPLVEVVRGRETSDETARAITELARELGKTPAVANDFPGFVSNRILMPLVNEAAYALLEGVAEPDAIDTIARLGFNHPMGPLALADLIGLDTTMSVAESLYTEFKEPLHAPPPLLSRMVEAGLVGRKAGRGFLDYR